MKNKDIKNMLCDEVEKATPNLTKNIVKSSYIEKPQLDTKQQKVSNKGFNSKKLVPSIISICLIVAVALTCGLVFGFQKDKFIQYNSYMTVEVCDKNAISSEGAVELPKVSITADSKNIINSAKADNESGQILLANISLNGKNLQDGTKLIVETSAKLGFIDVTKTSDNASRYIKITSSNVDEKVANNIENEITNYFKTEGIYSVLKLDSFDKNDLYQLALKYDTTVTLSTDFDKLNSILANKSEYYEDEIKQLEQDGMSKADAILTVFKVQLLKNIDELILKLDDIKDSYLISKLNTLKSFIDSSLSIFQEQINQVISFISDTIDGYKSYIVSIPTNVFELGNFLKDVSMRHADEMTYNNKEIYGEYRLSIEDKDYFEFSKKFYA